MIESDFYKLKIGQEIYFNNEKKTIRGIITYQDANVIRVPRNDFEYSEVDELHFDEIMAELSFEPPKQKRKYWQWLVIEKEGRDAYVPTSILDENGDGVSRREYFIGIKWDDLYFKQKIEDRCWEF